MMICPGCASRFEFEEGAKGIRCGRCGWAADDLLEEFSAGIREELVREDSRATARVKYIAQRGIGAAYVLQRLGLLSSGAFSVWGNRLSDESRRARE